MTATIEERVKEPVQVCAQCPSVKRNGEWYYIGYELISKVKDQYEVREEYCSHKCLIDYIVGAD